MGQSGSRVADFLCGLVRRTLRSPTKGLTQLLATAGLDGPPRLQAAPGSRIEGSSAESVGRTEGW